MGHPRFKHCVDSPVTFTHPSCRFDYPDFDRWRFMTHRMPRPEDVSRDHIDKTVMGFLKGERDADWTEVSLVTLHPREEIRLGLNENLDRYRRMHVGRFRELVAQLRFQRVLLQVDGSVSDLGK